MSAKHKLNAANFVGALVVAGVIGGACQSWLVFVVALAGLLVASVIAGDRCPACPHSEYSSQTRAGMQVVEQPSAHVLRLVRCSAIECPRVSSLVQAIL